MMDPFDPRDKILDYAPDAEPVTNPEDLLDVLQQAQEVATERRKAAQDMQAHYALVAILQGSDPVAVARKCGFKVTAASIATNAADSHYDSIMTQMMGQMMGVNVTPPRAGSDLDAFLSWLGAYVRRLVEGKVTR